MKFLTWFNNRFIDQSHIIRCELPKGAWHETDTKLLYGCMNELVEFVEVQCAWMEVMCDEDSKETLTWWHKIPAVRMLMPWKNPSLGVKRLTWESELVCEESGKSTSQAEGAKCILKIYLWWKAFQTREEPFHLLIEQNREILQNSYPEFLERAELRNPKQPLWMALADAYDAEEDVMLQQLMSVRRHLWT